MHTQLSQRYWRLCFQDQGSLKVQIKTGGLGCHWFSLPLAEGIPFCNNPDVKDEEVNAIIYSSYLLWPARIATRLSPHIANQYTLPSQEFPYQKFSDYYTKFNDSLYYIWSSHESFFVSSAAHMLQFIFLSSWPSHIVWWPHGWLHWQFDNPVTCGVHEGTTTSILFGKLCKGAVPSSHYSICCHWKIWIITESEFYSMVQEVSFCCEGWAWRVLQAATRRL